MTIRACCSIFSLRMAIFAMNLCLYIIFPCFVVRLCGVFTRTFSYDVGRIGDYYPCAMWCCRLCGTNRRYMRHIAEGHT